MEKLLELYERQIDILKNALEQIAASNQNEQNQKIAKQALTEIKKMKPDI
ncbi:hypothetical protein ACIQ4Z_15125 [Peribacillus asahii]